MLGTVSSSTAVPCSPQDDHERSPSTRNIRNRLCCSSSRRQQQRFKSCQSDSSDWQLGALSNYSDPAVPSSTNTADSSSSSSSSSLSSSSYMASTLSLDSLFQDENDLDGCPAVLRSVLAELRHHLEEKRNGEEEDEPATTQAAADPLRLAELWNTLGLIKLHMQRHCEQQAIECFQKAVRIFQTQHNCPHHALAVTFSDLAKCYERLSRHPTALELYVQAQSILLVQQKQQPSKPPLIAMTIDRSIARLQRYL